MSFICLCTSSPSVSVYAAGSWASGFLVVATRLRSASADFAL